MGSSETEAFRRALKPLVPAESFSELKIIRTDRGGDGIFVEAGLGGASSGLAGFFFGDVTIDRELNQNDSLGNSTNHSVSEVTIDHPLDPANQYLTMASVASPEMTSVTSGNVTTDESGIATVTLPAWFDAIHGDFRYQLTVVDGRFAQAIVSREIANHQFTISTNATRVKVSWQVAAVRQDAYAKAHPLVVEQQKETKVKGFYKHPELFGQPEEKQIRWATHPGFMQRPKNVAHVRWPSTKGDPKQRSVRSSRPHAWWRRSGDTSPAAVPSPRCVKAPAGLKRESLKVSLSCRGLETG